jgi:predicted nucleic acid-binding protein
VKLVSAEAETTALLSFLLRAGGDRVSSALARVEVVRAVRRAGLGDEAQARATRVLERIALVRLDELVLARAASLDPATLRSLDAIHLATALTLGGDLQVLVTYDRQLTAAAGHAGLPVASPGVP